MLERRVSRDSPKLSKSSTAARQHPYQKLDIWLTKPWLNGNYTEAGIQYWEEFLQKQVQKHRDSNKSNMINGT